MKIITLIAASLVTAATSPSLADEAAGPVALARDAGVDPQPEPQRLDPPVSHDRLRSWELPAVTVRGEHASTLREEDRVGSYAQPRWTATRRFPGTRVYVIPEGHVEVEAWARSTIGRDDGTKWRFLQEIEIGLPHRFQLDVYFRQDYATADDRTLLGGQFEMRYALADWGEIWGNPTLYLEYAALEDRPDKIEGKLLLGGEVAPGWHWGINTIAEIELSGEEEHEWSVSSGLSYTLIDSKLSIGVENILAVTDTDESRGDFETSDVIGPSLQWKPFEGATVNFAPLFGITNESPAAQIYLNIGWEF